MLCGLPPSNYLFRTTGVRRGLRCLHDRYAELRSTQRHGSGGAVDGEAYVSLIQTVLDTTLVKSTDTAMLTQHNVAFGTAPAVSDGSVDAGTRIDQDFYREIVVQKGSRPTHCGGWRRRRVAVAIRLVVALGGLVDISPY